MFDKGIRRISFETCIRCVEFPRPLLASTIFTQPKAELRPELDSSSHYTRVGLKGHVDIFRARQFFCLLLIILKSEHLLQIEGE